MKVLKALGAAAVVFATYLNHTFSPLFWVLLVLVALDIVMNAHQEGQQFQKIGSAFASLGGVTVLQGHLGNPDIVRISVAVLVLAYLQVVVPQLLTLAKKLHFSPAAKVNAVEQQLASKMIQDQAQQIAAMVRQQLQSDGVTTAAAGMGTASAVAQPTANAPNYHV